MKTNHLVIEITQFIFEFAWLYKSHKDEQLQNISNFVFKHWATKIFFMGKRGNWHLMHELGNEIHCHRNMVTYISHPYWSQHPIICKKLTTLNNVKCSTQCTKLCFHSRINSLQLFTCALRKCDANILLGTKTQLFRIIQNILT